MRVKDVVILRNEKTTDTSRRYIGLENITSWDAQFVETTSETEGTNNIFYPNDILFGKLRPYLAKGYIPQYEGICSTEFFVMSCKRGVLPHYLLYVFLSHAIIDYVKNQVAGVKMPRTNWNEFGNIKIVLPSLPDQQKIVSYLDEKTSAIDTQIDLLEKKKNAYTRLKKAVINRVVTRGLDEHVKLKDSGVEWIGMIPEHWEMKRIKELCSFVSRGATPDYVDDGEYKVMNQAVFSTGNLNCKVVRYSSYMKPDSQIKKGDLLIASTGGGVLGKLYFFDDEDTDFYADTHVTIVRNDKGSFYVKILFYLLSYQFDMINACMAKGSTNQTELQRDSLLSYEFAIPSLEEQQAIVTFLDGKCAKIDAALANIDKQIDALKRLKRSLINEVITGQRTV